MTAYFCRFIRTPSHLSVYMLAVAVFVLQEQNRVGPTEIVGMAPDAEKIYYLAFHRKSLPIPTLDLSVPVKLES